MPDDLYADDILRWSDRQAELLRRLARGERVNESVDWDNIIDEVASVGRSERASVASWLTNAMEHLIKIHAWPGGLTAHWRRETLVFLQDAQRRCAPSMRHGIDIQRLWHDARQRVAQAPEPAQQMIPDRCPCTIDQLVPPLPAVIELDGLLARLAPAGG